MKYLFLCLLLVITGCKDANPRDGFSARVVGVHDGDSLTVLDASKTQYKIRMAEIDAPEAKQDFGSRAKQMLSDLVFSQNVIVHLVEKDRYGRWVAHIEVNGKDVNRMMVQQGGAWVYRQYLKDQGLIQVEKAAREAGAGLWGVSRSPTPPWEWRKSRKKPK